MAGQRLGSRLDGHHWDGGGQRPPQEGRPASAYAQQDAEVERFVDYRRRAQDRDGSEDTVAGKPAIIRYEKRPPRTSNLDPTPASRGRSAFAQRPWTRKTT